MVEFFDCLGDEGSSFKSFGMNQPGKFVMRVHLQSTLRDLRALLTSPRLAATFAVVVLLFAVTGPFDTLAGMNFPERLGYWLAAQAGSWLLALTLSALADGLLQDLVPARLVRFILGSLAAAPLIGIYIVTLQHVLRDFPLDVTTVLTMTLQSLPLCLIFCVLSYMTMPVQVTAAETQASVASEPPPAVAPPASVSLSAADRKPPLLQRLSPQNRGALRHLSVEDHYTVVTTSRGRELILLRFADAMAETAPVEGLQVHRSHWVAKSAVSGLVRRDGKRLVKLDDGQEVPISRPYLASARESFPDIA